MSGPGDLVVIAVATARAGQEGAMLAALRACAGPTREQPGCVSFTLLRRADDPKVVVGLERWTSRAAHATHLQGPHIQRLMGAMGPTLAGPPDIVEYEVVDEA
jgi:quinol monooxygenase YgiN